MNNMYRVMVTEKNDCVVKHSFPGKNCLF